MKKKFDVAFAPLNNRLLHLAYEISRPLIKEGISVCILRTSFNGKNLSAFNDKNLNNKIDNMIPIIDVPFTKYKHRAKFFRNIVRTICTHNKLNLYWKAPYKSLVTFMDDYDIDEVLNIYSRKKSIPTIMIQEGSEPRRNKYNYSLYDFFSFLRNIIFRNYFNSKATGLNSDYVAAWSKINYQHFINNGRTSKNTFIVGSPYPLEKIKKIKKIRNIKKNILILHQTLYHRYSSVKWNDELWTELSTQLLKKGYNVIIKPHPRAGSKKESKLFYSIKKKAKLLNKSIQIIKKNILAEKLTYKADLLVTCNSVGANNALGNGIPVIYIDTEFSKNKVLHKLKKNNDIILVQDWNEAVNKIDHIHNNLMELAYWKKKGYSSLIKLSGNPEIFKESWVKLILKVINGKKKIS